MILTRRGLALLGVIVAGMAMASLYGPRSLNAVVAPAIVALGAGVFVIRRIDRPTVERSIVDEGFVGEAHTVELRFRAETPFTGRIRDEVPDGLATVGSELTTTIDDTTLAYEVTFARRGAHELGPVTVTARDVLGLAEREFTYPDRQEVLVYPRIHDLTGRARHDLNLLPDVELINTRGEFDNLREYQHGDPLRDVDWKSSAKQPDDDFIVKEYIDEEDVGEVRIVAETEQVGYGEPARTSADAMAEATASIAIFLLEAGLSVGVSAPDGALEPNEAHDQRGAILELLARTGAGRVPDGERREADLLVRADGTDVAISMEGREVAFERLAGGRIDLPGPPATTDAGEAA